MNAIGSNNIATDAEVLEAIAAHKLENDPHPQYLTEVEASILFNGSTNQQNIINVISMADIDGGSF